ncbi:dickkopf-related protein 3 [Nematostella vectensis]|nr:dickkopf-related protein 3 [Nematostella vectensis]
MKLRQITWLLLLGVVSQIFRSIVGNQDEDKIEHSTNQRWTRSVGGEISKKAFLPLSPFDARYGQERAQPRMLSPGYYSQECNAHKPCDKGRYCHMFLCVHCLKENVACTQNGQCCGGQCTYGRCKKDAVAGAPGTFCDRHDDCKDPAGTCCVRESAINPHISICKPPLEENMVCGPINFFKNVYIGAQVQRACGPCKQGLMCKQVGIFGVHEICVKEDDSKKK